ncbi:MAG TPA: nucleotide disphospho-sugar-binding domain-containing protein, partial [Polyangia bacterium]
LLAAVRASGCRAVIYTTDPALAGHPWVPEVLVVGRLPHALLFPRVALVVHHGGAGTIARAARAGIPQVILPHVLDQFPWSARIAERGLGPGPFLKHRPTSGLLAVRIRETLGDVGMRDRALNLARELAGRDGAARAAEMLTAD